MIEPEEIELETFESNPFMQVIGKNRERMQSLAKFLSVDELVKLRQLNKATKICVDSIVNAPFWENELRQFFDANQLAEFRASDKPLMAHYVDFRKTVNAEEYHNAIFRFFNLKRRSITIRVCLAIGEKRLSEVRYLLKLHHPESFQSTLNSTASFWRTPTVRIAGHTYRLGQITPIVSVLMRSPWDENIYLSMLRTFIHAGVKATPTISLLSEIGFRGCETPFPTPLLWPITTLYPQMTRLHALIQISLAEQKLEENDKDAAEEHFAQSREYSLDEYELYFSEAQGMQNRQVQNIPLKRS